MALYVLFEVARVVVVAGRLPSLRIQLAPLCQIPFNFNGCLGIWKILEEAVLELGLLLLKPLLLSIKVFLLPAQDRVQVLNATYTTLHIYEGIPRKERLICLVHLSGGARWSLWLRVREDDHRTLVFIIAHIHLLGAHRPLHGGQCRVLIVEFQWGIQRCETLHGSRDLVGSATCDFELIVPMLIEKVLWVQGSLCCCFPFGFGTLQMIIEVGLPERYEFISVHPFLINLLGIWFEWRVPDRHIGHVHWEWFDYRCLLMQQGLWLLIFEGRWLIIGRW